MINDEGIPWIYKEHLGTNMEKWKAKKQLLKKGRGTGEMAQEVGEMPAQAWGPEWIWPPEPT